jgi:hypothetical protein
MDVGRQHRLARALAESHGAHYGGRDDITLLSILDRGDTPQVADEDLKQISTLQHLLYLEIDCGNRITDAGMIEIGKLTNLETFLLKSRGQRGLYGKITDSGVSHLRGLSSLKSLQLLGVRLSDEGLAAIADLDLEELFVESDRITSNGLEHVARFRNLRALGVYETAIDDRGIALLAKMKGLKTLRLSGTKVSDEGMERLRRSLPGTEIYH